MKRLLSKLLGGKIEEAMPPIGDPRRTSWALAHGLKFGEGWAIRVGDAPWVQPAEFNTFDIDGVIFINKHYRGVHPGPHDVLLTGRSYEEMGETFKMLDARGIMNKVIFNPLPFDKKTRESSGVHKGETLKKLINQGYNIGCHFDSDINDLNIIKELNPNLELFLLKKI
jgi:hypothetical protein